MSDLRRFFVDKIEDNVVVVKGDEFQHAVNVLRIKQGQDIILCDNSKKEHLAKITAIEKKQFTCEIFQVRESDKECLHKVTLICGYLKGDKNEWVVQKATELGVFKIVFFSSQFSCAYVNENKLERLKKVSLEACKQCERANKVEIVYENSFEKALEHATCCPIKLIAYENEKEVKFSFFNLFNDCAIVVGSEGGFSESEVDLAKEKLFTSISLGKRILRAETASIALCTLVVNGLGEL